MQPILEIKNISKKFKIREGLPSYLSLRDSIASALRNPSETLFPASTDFWALKDISLDIYPGDSLGIIGKNGAGKSTLLKILSRITPPTSGKVISRGRIASLLEVGTGFHSELSGRENVFLNGSILGMRRNEIKNKFDEIVDFSGVEKFIDTPLKHYSSGMQLRLAFAVAAFLESEILIIDEVLAVGDAEFQKKCIRKIEEVSKHQGRSLLYVSHNLGTVERLCNKAVILHKGTCHEVTKDVSKAISTYLGDLSEISSSSWRRSDDDEDNGYFCPERLYFTDASNQTLNRPILRNEKITLHIIGEVLQPDPALHLGFNLYTFDGHLLYMSYYSDSKPEQQSTLRKGKHHFQIEFPTSILNEDSYILELNCGLHFIKWIIPPHNNYYVIKFDINGDFKNNLFWFNRRPGLLAPELQWNTTSN